VRRLKQLEAENARLKKLVAERDLEIEVMKEFRPLRGKSLFKYVQKQNLLFRSQIVCGALMCLVSVTRFLQIDRLIS
jgi:hypothetical protein